MSLRDFENLVYLDVCGVPVGERCITQGVEDPAMMSARARCCCCCLMFLGNACCCSLFPCPCCCSRPFHCAQVGFAFEFALLYLAMIEGRPEEEAEAQLSLRYGHFPIEWPDEISPMYATFEVLEYALAMDDDDSEG